MSHYGFIHHCNQTVYTNYILKIEGNCTIYTCTQEALFAIYDGNFLRTYNELSFNLI